MFFFKLNCAILLSILIYVPGSDGAKVLGVFPNSGYSQYILGSALMKGLAERGHEVTMISGYTQRTPIKNLREIPTKEGNDLLEGDFYEMDTMSVIETAVSFYDELCLNLAESTLSHPRVQKLLKSEETFDLVITELFGNEVHAAFAYHYKTPLIYLSSQGANEWSNNLVANPAPFSYIPIVYSGYSSHMNFWQRLRNSMIGAFDLTYRYLIIYPKQEKMLQTYFPGAPKLADLMYNASIVLLNSNVAMNIPSPIVPNMIEVGGFHVSPKPVPADLKDFLDGAKDGAVFFSMGSNMKSKDLSKEKVAGILKVFSKLKQRVLWKWEDENLPGKPANVKVGKWLPQQDILAHPNIRAFITHGGLLSTTEATYSGVPMITIPVFGDQKMNAAIAEENGVAIKIFLKDFTEDNLSWALNEILTNSSYREAARRRSKILHDQPVNPMDKAIFWIEYVLRHKGATHLRSAALNLTWYQYLLLDVIAFVITATSILLYICKLLLRKLFCNSNDNKKQKRKIKDQ